MIFPRLLGLGPRRRSRPATTVTNIYRPSEMTVYADPRDRKAVRRRKVCYLAWLSLALVSLLFVLQALKGWLA